MLDLNHVVRDSEKILHRLIGEDIHLSCTLDPALAQVEADPGQVHQVIMNLVVNARDAMPDGGNLIIETANVTLEENWVSPYPDARPGEYVTLAVRDTGQGMDRATVAQIFEPFFTTNSTSLSR
jgi:signal transduction histidine kinase